MYPLKKLAFSISLEGGEIVGEIVKIVGGNKFTGLNYQDWLRNLNIVLASEKLLYTIEKSPPKEAPADISPEELVTLQQWWNNELKTRMLCDGIDV
ncbi:hypothetical protein F511_47481 [Dorcoceras hygrometricum]|uniref:Uncharacterized protein n=1 Tax=Dorcoceras hygrometricum TaxID=472368 RepID=A0A2Z6ZRY1_9LAMI|nr:hypothetical protein F511_47481 [Dorcoceras hygrometricum]